MTPSVTVLAGHVLERLRDIPDHSADCVVTSPPYFGQRAYSTAPQVWGGAEGCDHQWQMSTRKGQTGGTASPKVQIKGAANFQIVPDTQSATCGACGAWRGELGAEPTPELYVQHLVEIFRACKRVLKPTGSLWVNIGDCYTSGGRIGHGTRVGHKQQTVRGMNGQADPARPPLPPGLKPKDLVGVPWLLAFALRADGWYLRSENIWHKPNQFPSSALDRTTHDFEHVFHLALRQRYYYDGAAIMEPLAPDSAARYRYQFGGTKHEAMRATGSRQPMVGMKTLAEGRNKRAVWSINTQSYRGAHFAVMPEALAEIPIKATASEYGCCPRCGRPWRRMAAGWSPTCRCDCSEVVPAVVLDPFAGSGTVLAVAKRLGRAAIGIELNPDYLPLIEARLAAISGSAARRETGALSLFDYLNTP